jgi:hypothetical protein
VKLFRADVGMLGVELSGLVDVHISYEYGFWNFAGRLADRSDIKKIGLVPDPAFRYPDAASVAPLHWGNKMTP